MTVSNRNAGTLIKHQRGNIHAAGRSSHPQNKANARTNKKPGEQGGQQRIISQAESIQKSLKEIQKQWVTYRTKNSGKYKIFPQNKPAQQQHGKVDYPHSYHNRQSAEMLYKQSNPCGAARQQPAGKDKCSNAKSEYSISQ